MIPARNNDINSLSPAFRYKFDLRWAEVISKYPNAVVFETRRSQERQNALYAQGRTTPWQIVTRTTTSNHKDGNAVDIVFMNNGKIEWKWPYQDLINMAVKYNIRNLAPRELCHFEDNGVPLTTDNLEDETIKEIISLNSKLYNMTNDPEIKSVTNVENIILRTKI